MTHYQEQLAGSEFTEKIEALVLELKKVGATLNGVKPPTPEFQTEYDQLLKQVSQVRGRDLFYPYVGSGGGSGVFVELQDGSVKMDLINGIGIHLFGHSHPDLVRASLKASLQDVVNQGNLQPNLEYLQLGSALVEHAKNKSQLKHIWLSTCGSMANENALKIVRQKKSPARKIIAMKDAFAGRSTMMAEITDNVAYKKGLPEYNEVLRVPFATTTSLRSCNVSCKEKCRVSNESEAVLSLLKRYVEENPGDICCFTFEPMLGEGGYKVACREFFVPILRYLREQGIPIWADEVQTFGRTGELFAFETLGIGEFVDVVTIAKTAQLGATLFTSEMNPEPGLVAGTFAGATAQLATGLESVRLLQEGGYFGPHGRIEKIHQKFLDVFDSLRNGSCKGMVKDAGGLGVMMAMTPFDGEKENVMKVLRALYKNGVIAFNCGKSPVRLRFLIPVIIKDEEIELFGHILEKSLLEVAKEIDWSS